MISDQISGKGVAMLPTLNKHLEGCFDEDVTIETPNGNSKTRSMDALLWAFGAQEDGLMVAWSKIHQTSKTIGREIAIRLLQGDEFVRHALAGVSIGQKVSSGSHLRREAMEALKEEDLPEILHDMVSGVILAREMRDASPFPPLHERRKFFVDQILAHKGLTFGVFPELELVDSWLSQAWRSQGGGGIYHSNWRSSKLDKHVLPCILAWGGGRWEDHAGRWEQGEGWKPLYPEQDEGQASFCGMKLMSENMRISIRLDPYEIVQLFGGSRRFEGFMVEVIPTLLQGKPGAFEQINARGRDIAISMSSWLTAYSLFMEEVMEAARPMVAPKSPKPPRPTPKKVEKEKAEA